MNPQVKSFHDPATATFTHVVYDRDGGHAAVIDPVLDYDPASARVTTESADRVLAFVAERGLALGWVLETHVHADHLTAAAHIKRKTGARTGIGRGIRAGELPPADDNGIRYLRLPLNQLGGAR
ncbi:MBL fold metallo-hydrolase [Novilysobacter defluvii]|uniref:Metallo-beta-lactamase domain-containing protein n=1 Tax=Lysobacter defluvii IMMIB APB-9 = DSM 18482 TaxID=1385515 RepID=A0A0A0MAP9_9GAMM|nr:MBL fold metallo-hydrolase [Lysobacter defluvii]KGO99237.1 hypothetical protein N791_05725 [Lysobacter defluvii IMMIB APB-9 = DSM 18482]